MIVVAALAAPLLLSTAPAQAAGGGAPKVRILSDATVYENTYTTLQVRYRCATGTTASLVASVRQGGTPSAPRALYDTNHPDAYVPPLVCDGDRHVVGLGLISVGSVEEGVPGPDYGYLQETATGGGRVYATVVLTDDRTSRSDRDEDRMVAEPR